MANDLPWITSLNLIPGLSGTKAEAQCMMLPCLPKECWSRMRAHFPGSGCFSLSSSMQTLFIVSLCVN